MNKAPFQLTVFTGMHQRLEVARLWCIGMQRFLAAAPAQVVPRVFVVCSSPGAVELCRQFNFEYLETDNRPLGRKFNNGLRVLMEKHQPHYVLMTGDDNLFANAAWPLYLAAMEQGLPHVGFEDVYFYSPADDMLRHGSYRHTSATHKMWGAGRLCSAHAIATTATRKDVVFTRPFNKGGVIYLPQVNYSLSVFEADYFMQNRYAVAGEKRGPYFEFWDDPQNSGLDFASNTRLIHHGFLPQLLPAAQPLMIDLKTTENIWGIGHLIGQHPRVSTGLLQALLPALELQYMAAHWPPSSTGTIQMQHIKVVLQKGFQQRDQLLYHLQQLVLRQFPDVAVQQLTCVPFMEARNYYEFYTHYRSEQQRFLMAVHVDVMPDELAAILWYSIDEKQRLSNPKTNS